MKLSNKNAVALLYDLIQDIEEYSEATIKQFIQERIFDLLTYAPN